MTNTNDLNEQKRNEFYGFVYMTTNLINGKRYIGQRKYYGESIMGITRNILEAAT